ncbi:MAG: DUF4011 domain-containing protein [Kiritimatiellae bacterium]|nr:DUF4011 domain-containing protein [Kiritimatiellia bacterium]
MDDISTSVTGKATSRVERWTQKLLDLSLRNRLLNARDSKQIVPLASGSLDAIENRLAADRPVAVESADAANAPSDALRATLPEEETRRRLKELYRLAKTDLEESGVNALYLALGFLVWKPKGPDAKSCRAPILLMPVRMVRKNVREGYAISRLDEDTALNATLVEFLRSGFGLSVEGVDPLPEDESGVDVQKVFAAFRGAVGGMEGWNVEEDAAIGNFSFGKFVMWKDLTARADRLASHPFVSHLMKGGGDYDDGIEVFPPEEIGSHVKYGELFTPLSADSSQLAAVLYSAMGKSFVLHGPPGTGKSQTITNLIAHNLAHGRKVLFVSEKKAALDVVHRRLASVGLKPFCLELHSNKSGKTEVLAQFKEALDYVDKGTPNEWQRTIDQISNYRSELDAVVAALHKRQKNGLSAYDCFASKISPGPDTLPIDESGLKCCDWDAGRIEAAREAVRTLVADSRGTTTDVLHALGVVKPFAWTPEAERTIAERLRMLLAKPKTIRALAALFQGYGFAGFRGDFAERLEKAIAAMPESRGAMRWIASRDALAEKTGREFADSLSAAIFRALDGESGSGAPGAGGSFDGIGPSQALDVFDRSFAAATLDGILRVESALASFAGLKREEQILEFRRLDAEYAELVKHAVRARLAKDLPLGRLGECSDGCELGIVRRECAKKARQKPIRRLLAEARGVVGRLKPCFLMSPLSVAQYLPAEASFDLVVFDEASQIPVWDAIGVIARAKQCIVVGDPKQMPPTNFFQKGETGEEDQEDLESILDECLAAGLHSAYLSWHYRSRHESLIAFSNRHYYGDRLCTFPAAGTAASLGVAWHFVENGEYDAKASRTNRAEAEALADYVFSCLADQSRKRRSAGVVAFSMAQKNLIEDIMEERRSANPEFEDYFADDGEEPFFVKNLENVQGDERDVILFSVGYAKGPDGKFLMNFGPLNRAGGERRLNVAVTRAKEQIVVFASCRGAEIDLSRTQAVGAAHLKAFLEYAERGGEASASDADAMRRDKFADEVASFLAKRGYAVERDIGRSGFRVDIGVKDPARTDRYLAAIECDGDSYASALTARDRDELRASVLRSLGWNVVRVWSADWAFDRARGEERLLKELDAIGRAPDGKLPLPKFVPEVTFPRRRAVSAADAPRTDLDKVSNDDLRAKMDEVERDFGRCDKDSLYRETVKRFGYKTLSPKARARLEGVRRF